MAQSRAVVEGSPLALAATEGATHVVRYVNPAFSLLTGHAAAALIGQSLHAVVPAAHRAGVVALLDRVHHTGETASAADLGDGYGPARDAAYATYAAWPLLGDDQRPRGVLVHVSDTTPSVLAPTQAAQAAEELQAANAHLLLAGLQVHEQAEVAQVRLDHLNALLERLGEAVTIQDGTGQVVLINQAARTVLGVTANDGLRTPSVADQLEWQQPDGTPLPPELWPLNRAQLGERFDDVDVLLLRPDGARLRLNASGSAIRDRAGRVILAIVVYRDVTELRRLEQAKGEYVALISHDLRTPLAVIQGQADLLSRNLAREGNGDPRRLDQLATIRRTTRHMSSMIQDLLDSSRLESGHLMLRLAPLDLVRLSGDVVQRLSSVDDRVVFAPGSTDQLPVSADADRIERVLTNLLTNALKFSPPKTPVVVSVRQQNGEAEVAVADRGVGIPADQRSRIFERFEQSGSDPSARTAGLGLGLYIARLIVEAHGGRLWVESVLGEGSTFRFTLPMLRPDDRGPSPRGEVSLEPDR